MTTREARCSARSGAARGSSAPSRCRRRMPMRWYGAGRSPLASARRSATTRSVQRASPRISKTAAHSRTPRRWRITRRRAPRSCTTGDTTRSAWTKWSGSACKEGASKEKEIYARRASARCPAKGLGTDVKSQSKPRGTRLDLMRLCPQPTAYEPDFTQTERPVVVAIADIPRVYLIHQNPGGQAALVALSRGVIPPM